MERNFLFIQHFLEAEFPGIHVDGGNYPPPPIIELLMMFMKGTQLFAMGLIIFGDGLWTNILRFRSVPTFYYKVKENYFVSFVLVFFVIPRVLKKYEKTGAFRNYCFVINRFCNDVFHEISCGKNVAIR